MLKTIVIYTKYKRLLLYKQLCKNLIFNNCIFYKYLNNSLIEHEVFIDEYYLMNDTTNLVNYLKNQNNNKIFIILWNGLLDKFLYQNKINFLKKKFPFINFYFMGASFYDCKSQKNFNYLFSKKINRKINYKFRYFYFNLILSNIKFYFDYIFNFRKINLFKNRISFIFVGQWKFYKKEVNLIAKKFNVNIKDLNSFLEDIDYYSDEKFEKNQLKINKIKHKKLFKNNSFNYFMYNLIIRKKILLSLKKQNKIQIIDDYSKPDFLNFRFDTKSIFLDLGSKYGSSDLYPRQFALKINYPNNNVLINYFYNKEAKFKNLLYSFDYIRLICDNIRKDSHKKFINKKIFNNFNKR